MKQSLTIFTLTVISLITSCKQENQVFPANIIVLVDFSQSRDSTAIKWYKATIQHSILEKMSAKDRLLVLPIDFYSETSGEEIFKVDFSKNDYSNEYAVMQKDEIEDHNHLDSVHAAIEMFNPLFDSARQRRAIFRGGTDIFGGLAQCRKYMVPQHRNVVIIFSDMLQFTDRTKWNFEDHLNHVNEVDKYLSAAVKIDLKDIEIIVLTGAQNDMHPEKFNAVRTFWEKYFTMCGGSLVDYSSGAVTKIEEELKNKPL